MIISKSDIDSVRSRMNEIFDLMQSGDITISDLYVLELLHQSYSSLFFELCFFGGNYENLSD